MTDQPTQYIGRISLLYLVAALGSTASLALRFEQVQQGIGWGHAIAYWLINALWMLGVWFFINWPTGPWETFVTHPAIRKAIGGIGCLVAILVSNIGFYWMIESKFPANVSVWFLIIALALIALYTGLACTRIRPIAEYSKKDQGHAEGLRSIGIPLGGALVVAVAGPIFASDRAMILLENTWADLYLRIALVLTVLCACTSLILIPWLIEQEIEVKGNHTGK